jgi:hypothetical protein
MKCVWCPQSATHALDGQRYCCACFDQLVEKCGNVKSLIVPAPAQPLPPHIQERMHALAKQLHRSRAAAFRCATQKKRATSR